MGAVVNLETMPWKELGVALLSGSVLTSGIGWLSKRNQRNAYTMGAVDHAVQTAMQVVTDRLEVVEKQHGECEVSLREVNTRLDRTERERTALKAEIERLMQGAVATYGGEQ